MIVLFWRPQCFYLQQQESSVLSAEQSSQCAVTLFHQQMSQWSFTKARLSIPTWDPLLRVHFPHPVILTPRHAHIARTHFRFRVRLCRATPDAATWKMNWSHSSLVSVSAFLQSDCSGGYLVTFVLFLLKIWSVTASKPIYLFYVGCQIIII